MQKAPKQDPALRDDLFQIVSWFVKVVPRFGSYGIEILKERSAEIQYIQIYSKLQRTRQTQTNYLK